MTLSRRQRHEQHYAVRDWHLEAPHNPEERIHWLRAEAAALISEARSIELQLFPSDAPAHACAPLCEFCLAKALGVKI